MSRIIFSKNFERDIPSKLYHATYRIHLPSIYKKGLLPDGTVCNWGEKCEYGVYLSDDPDVAQSYAEVGDFAEYDDDVYDDIVVIEVDTALLDRSKFSNDPHILENDYASLSSFLYRGTILPSALNLKYSKSVKIHKKAQNIKNYLDIGHYSTEDNYLDMIWLWAYSRGEFKKVKTHRSDGHKSYPELLDVEFSGRYDPKIEVISVAPDDIYFKYGINKLPKTLISLLKKNFGNNADIYLFMWRSAPILLQASSNNNVKKVAQLNNGKGIGESPSSCCSIDYGLIVRAEQLATGANIHKIKNIISNYISSFRLLEEKYSDTIRKIFENSEKMLVKFVASNGRLKVANINIKDHLRSRGVDLDSTKVYVDEESNTASFPLYDPSGKMIGYQRYNPNTTIKHNQGGKYDPEELRYFSYVSEPYKKVAMWNWEDVVSRNEPFVFVAEGIFDAMKIKNMGLPVLAVLGASKAKDLRNQMFLLGKKIIAILDNDKAGNDLKKISHSSYVLEKYKDLGDAPQEYVNDFINDILEKEGFNK